ncbi:uncharacterized protein [Mytilus edulis]|uniref:uncharacterized protein n=1 Tax=Mytilus edulis TaxID=6550 RepID=UPI0039EF6E43
MQEIKSLQQEVKAVSAQTHSLTVNERAHSQDFLALYNITIEQKAAVSALHTNSSNQLMKLRELETNHSKQLLRLEQNHNSTTAEIISKLEAIKKQENLTLSMMQKQINKNAERVAITAYPSSGVTLSEPNTILKFNDEHCSVGITNLTAYRTTGKFTCEHEGLYIISASLMSFTGGANYHISLNGKAISQTDIDHSGGGANEDRIGAVTLTWKLNLNDQVWLESGINSWYLYGGQASTFTIVKIK